ncbi:type I polyketide synthase [Pendulispora albinea]|uniref:Type I polyketide synthase n=1 Tax=Pendulispora albinea TaxID=2741071 RepID=A0ABZ2M453_9BACT
MAKSSESVIPRRIDPSENIGAADLTPVSGLRTAREIGEGRERGWPGGLRRRLVGVSGSERTSILLGLVAGHVAGITGRGNPQIIEADAPWRQLGIYQKYANQLRDRLSEATGLRLPATSFFDYPTPGALVDYLVAELLGEHTAADVPEPEKSGMHDDPIAIVGMGCRYPGGITSPEQLWELVSAGRDAISTMPENRGWDVDGVYDPEPGQLGKTYTREGGFIHDVDQFDPAFFGISPREAAALDPQQRVLLETSWEALERAGIDPVSLRGSRTGVFVGIAYQDYGPNWHEPPKDFNGHLLMGSLTSAASGRVAYTLGLEGPALTVDTACSSSLVSLHLACQALRNGECSLALTGGATVMATPGVFLEFSVKRGLSADGRCKSFSKDADGTGWGEGAGMLVLERLSDARRNGHQVLALVRGTALNQDGASNGLTAPNGPAQKRVIRQALSNAGLTAAEVDAVDAHGTGTTLGDPIEAQALLATYGQGRPDGKPLALGSLKSNIGHTQAAAAVGSVIKMVMAMHHGVLPKTLHVSEPSPHIDWSAGAVSLLTEAKPWLRAGHPRRCGVSAFGVSGTNGHVILEEAPGAAVGVLETDDPESAPPASGVANCEPWTVSLLPFPISGKGAPALRAQAAQLGLRWEAADWEPIDVGYSLAARTHFKHRAVVLAEGREGVLRGLTAIANEQSAPGIFQGVVQPGGKLAFLFTGQGSQRLGMGRALYEAFPPFADAFDTVCAQLDGHLGRSLREVIFADESSPDAQLLDQTVYTQTALFAVEVSLFRLMEAWGITPHFLIGHSIGELTAAHVAGVIALEDACALVAARGRLMQACRPGGAMVAVQGREDEVRATLPEGGMVDIATVNGPLSTVIAGDEEAVMEVARAWEAKGRKIKRLRVSHAFHSPHMDSMLDTFRRVAESVAFAPPAIPIVSNVTGELATAQELGSAEYWVRHVRQAVRFFDGMRTLQDKGVTAFLELGPDAILTAMGQGCLSEEHSERAVLVPSLRAKRPEVETLMTALAELYVRGVDVNWQAAFTGRGPQRIDLPTYAFQRQRFWLEAPRLAPEGGAAPATNPVAKWHYRVTWNPFQPSAPPRTGGTWLALVPASRSNDARVATVLRGLEGSGASVIRMELQGSDAHRETLRARLEQELAAEGVRGVLSLLALDEAPHGEHRALATGVALTVAATQALHDLNTQIPLWCVTQGAVSISDADALQSPTQAMVWGLGRIVGLEQPTRWGGLIDLPAGDANLDPASASALARVLASEHGDEAEREIALRGENAWVRRLVRAETPAPEKPWQPQGTVLITGGTGALGAQSARWLARHGAKRLVLVSRRGLNAPGAPELMAELVALGTHVTVAACDIADSNAIVKLLTSLPEPVTSVVHAAGVVGRIAPLTDTTLEEFAEVVAGKVEGAVHFDALTALPSIPALDAFVLFSSVAGTWGARGQTAYGAANAFLEALAHQRRTRGLPTTSVAWGPWAEAGMAADPTLDKHLRRHGVPPMAPTVATEALWQAVARGDTALTVIDVNWPTFLPTLSPGRTIRLFDDIPETRPAPASSPSADAPAEATPANAPSPWVQRLAAASEAEIRPILVELVRTHAAAILGYGSPNDVDPEVRFLDLGFDSLAAVDLRKRLVASTGLKLHAAIVLEHPNCVALSQQVAKAWAEHAPRAAAAPTANQGAAGEAGDANASAVSPTASIRLLYRSACQRMLVAEGIQLLRACAKLRPVMQNAEEFGKPMEAVKLAEGPKTALVCLPPIVAPSGPHNYAHLAARFHKERDVYAFANPGFGDGEPLPATREVVIKMHADAIRRQMGDTPFMLAGYSSGGWVVHAVAAYLEKQGVFPKAVVFLDALPVRERAWEKVHRPLQTLAVREQSFGLTTDDQLTAMAGYFDQFEHWKPESIQAPIVLIRATEPIPEWKAEDVQEEFWKATWDIPLEILDVPGDHFTLMNEQVETTADILRGWFARNGA